ncbi:MULTISPECIES: ComEA family DNA-binding protein [Acinetobacter]|uniref:ComEA family DNA-binding protein n=1 Tax=Acinetobacter TaxID=469 RepID=UPI000B4D702F|nr:MULTISPECIES: ComEA family DNA-binding protein [Acinetobacter]MBO3640766.1 ComEA family DNA-binding protein [Acinetobacter soli]MCL9677153.1 ComEA family DNA-binding protein [Acinetobacter sp. ACZLY 512]MDQ8997114.1 ComEA family DNA-binding protein [Acinetobacter soli]PPB86049.1 transporter [Acinetobacter soli]WEH88859.1 ComEA family DNA-binding protein [Acinetobacter soli]
MMIRIFYGALCALLTSLLFSSSLYAQAFDQQYQAWKSQQQAHDARLQSSHSNYYLAKPSLQANTGPKVNINTATAKDLQQLHGVGEKKALSIVEYRQQYGRFNSVDDLQKVKGIGPKFIEKNRHRLAI